MGLALMGIPGSAIWSIVGACVASDRVGHRVPLAWTLAILGCAFRAGSVNLASIQVAANATGAATLRGPTGVAIAMTALCLLGGYDLLRSAEHDWTLCFIGLVSLALFAAIPGKGAATISALTAVLVGAASFALSTTQWRMPEIPKWSIPLAALVAFTAVSAL